MNHSLPPRGYYKAAKKSKKAILIGNRIDEALEHEVSFEGLELIDSPAFSIARRLE